MLQPELSQSGAVLEAGVSGAPVLDEGLRVHILQTQGVPKALPDQLHIYIRRSGKEYVTLRYKARLSL